MTDVITYSYPTKVGRAAVVDWLGGVLREPQHAEALAADLICKHDWTVGCRLEVSGLKTTSGNPSTYELSGGEIAARTSDE